ncbi:hypothetical protein VCRA2126O85_410026 [Vibrio crassostreae]|nr:hypothetical protein VCRA2128O106_400019 [Vibrio crassostreae]CAK2948102.1 hypothetical protein VCRA2128O100_420019 [Vibrio crassostreae]CAK2948115.1 hypothetical protein VCRA2125O83_400026 [Vibrio crassostreae]CAK2949696.1 hypothetical protein VCRA2126O86_410026 [Vibrio crassostreae]CAK2951187.1 hypothetical protein VCRA2126O84_400019 [Vibrio crassostreae]
MKENFFRTHDYTVNEFAFRENETEPTNVFIVFYFTEFKLLHNKKPLN